MELKTQTDAELISLRDKLDGWCKRHQSSKWGHRLWMLIVILGLFAFIDGIADIVLSGIAPSNIVLILLGAVTCFTWYKSDKRRRANINFLVEIDNELVRRNLTEESTDGSSEIDHVAP